jgi:hypothetical protein
MASSYKPGLEAVTIEGSYYDNYYQIIDLFPC